MSAEQGRIAPEADLASVVWADNVAADAALAARCGGKAASLARLTRDGLNPPGFFVILPEAFDADGPRAGIAEALERALRDLGEGPFAVRSSGSGEDGDDHSHAGQFLSLLDVEAPDVPVAAHRVWRSGFAAEAYRAERGIADPAGGIAVVVQRMVRARKAGVAFSADPVSGRRDRVVISAVEGLADRLVSGETDGCTYSVSVGTADIEGPSDGVLTADELGAVAALARTAEKLFGRPQDIEWAIDDAGLHILQSRPVTTPLRPLPRPDPAIMIFDNSNIVESYPGVVSPLTYSFAVYAYARVYRAFVRLVGVPARTVAEHAAIFDNMLARIDGRVYYNLVNWYRALALMPAARLNSAHMETMMGVAEPLPEEVRAGLVPERSNGLRRLSDYGRTAVVALGLVYQAVRVKSTVRAFERRFERAIAREGFSIEEASLSELAEDYRRIESLLLDRWDAPLVNDFLCMMAFGASRKLMERWFGDEGLKAHNRVMIGQGDIISAEPTQRILKIAGAVAAVEGLADEIEAGGLAALESHEAIRAEIDAYIARFGDRCTGELKLESVTLDEDPTALLLAVAAAARRPDDRAGPEPEERPFPAIAAGRPIRRRIAAAILSWTKARVRDRENLRFERTRIFGRARRVFLAMGRDLHALGHLDDPRDVFFLTVQELFGSIEGFGASQELRPLVAVRRAEHEAALARPDPAPRILVRGAAIGVRDRRGASAEVKREGSEDAERRGIPCSAGKVTARARVVRDPARDRLEAGDVLVASHTDPGWIALFSNASAIVVERGSLLSHSAIVARELGIPCVVGLAGATGWIRDGETISVDGGTGDVRRRGTDG